MLLGRPKFKMAGQFSQFLIPKMVQFFTFSSCFVFLYSHNLTFIKVSEKYFGDIILFNVFLWYKCFVSANLNTHNHKNFYIFLAF